MASPLPWRPWPAASTTPVFYPRTNPLARVQTVREFGAYRSREAIEEEVERYWPRLVKVWPAYQAFYDRSGRRSLFVLEPRFSGRGR